MKLLNCLQCHDIKKIRIEEWVECECGECKAKYQEDGMIAEIYGPGRMLALSNSEYRESIVSMAHMVGMFYHWTAISDRDPGVLRMDGRYYFLKEEDDGIHAFPRWDALDVNKAREYLESAKEYDQSDDDS